MNVPFTYYFARCMLRSIGTTFFYTAFGWKFEWGIQKSLI